MNLILGLIAACGNLLGGFIVFGIGRDAGGRAASEGRALQTLLNVGAGFLLSVTILEMIPAALRTVRPEPLAAGVILSGYLFLYLIETTVSRHVHTVTHVDGSTADESDHLSHSSTIITSRSLYAALVGLTIHSFFDGVAIGSGAELSRSLGWLLMIAIVLHKIPEGATAGSLAMLAGLGRRAVLVVPLILGGATLAGVALVAFIDTRFVGLALGLAAGVTLYIAASDLVPHVRSGRTARHDPFLLLVGVALFAVTDYLLRLFGPG